MLQFVTNTPEILQIEIFAYDVSAYFLLNIEKSIHFILYFSVTILQKDGILVTMNISGYLFIRRQNTGRKGDILCQIDYFRV